MEEFLKSISQYFAAHTDADGRARCAKHGVEHVGKTTYSILIDIYLYEVTQKDIYLERAKARVLRVTALLAHVNGVSVFYPDGDPKWNMSNAAIDSGAVVDTLSVFLQKYEPQCSHEECEEIRTAITRCCDSYLKNAAVVKPHTNQRLWAATGVAAAATLMSNQDWKTAALASVEKSIAEIKPDGMIPYVTDFTAYKFHAGINDTTTYYHSRHLVYALYALEEIGELSPEYISAMRPAVDFLLGMYQSNGVKNINFETKRWYFTSPYEVGSHPYDIYVFTTYFEYTGEERYARAARESFQMLEKHLLLPEGGVRDHVGGVENFQCPYFWNSHCAWLTRIADKYAALPETARSHTNEFTHFKDSDVVVVKKPEYHVILRGSKESMSPLWGPRVGGGSVLYAGFAIDQFANRAHVHEDHTLAPGNFLLRRGVRKKISRADLVALLFYVRVELRARDWRTAHHRLRTLCRYVFQLRAWYGSQYFVSPRTTVVGESITFDSGLMTPDGVVLPGVELLRRYDCMPEGMRVEETLTGHTTGSLQYRLPKKTTELSVTGAVHTLSSDMLTLTKLTNNVTITYSLQ